MAAAPIYGKKLLKILFSGTKRLMALKLGMQHWWLRPSYFYSNDDPLLTLTFFYGKAKIWSLRLLCGKRWNSGFFRFYCSLRHQSWFMRSAKWTFINTKNQGYLLISGLDTSYSILLTSTPQKMLGCLKLNYMWRLHGMWEFKFVLGFWVTWPRFTPCQYIRMVKPFTNPLLRTERPMTLKLGVQPWGIQALQILCNNDPRLSLTYFNQGQLDHLGICMGKR